MFCTDWFYTVYISNWGWNDKYKNRQVDAKWAIDKLYLQFSFTWGRALGVYIATTEVTLI